MQIGLVGSTNVGKSTLFNKLINQHRAIVTDISGTTIDILYHQTTLAKVLADKSRQKPQHGEELIDLTFADSPGLDNFEAERPYISRIITESDLLLFVVDSKIGLTTKERQIHDYITHHGYKAKTLFILNKIDKNIPDEDHIVYLSDYYSLGYDHMFPITAAQGFGIKAIKDYIAKQTKSHSHQQTTDTSTEHSKIKNEVSLGIVGKPNAGKSTLLNFLANNEVSKVSNIPGTTRDYITQQITRNDPNNHQQINYTLYDTAGIKKKSQIKGIDAISYAKTLKMLAYIKPTVLFMIDGVEGLTHRDQTLLKEVADIGVPLIIVINKIDLLNTLEIKRIVEYVRDHLPFAKHAPLAYISAQTGRGVSDLFVKSQAIQANKGQQFSTSKLNNIIQKARVTKPPRFPKNKACKIFYLTQVEVIPYRFKVFINHKNRATAAFKRRTENVLRNALPLEGHPIFLHFIERKKNEVEK